MVIYKVFGGFIVNKELLDVFIPQTSISTRWKHWKSFLDGKTCMICCVMNGKIFSTWEQPILEPPVHEKCRCIMIPMQAVDAGLGTKDGDAGADWWLKNVGRLPENYISYPEIYALGWKRGKAPEKYAPGKMITMGIYLNSDGRLPDAPGRIWYEADINYYSGRRNAHRILWSNDGLIFVTYDHYATFMEII